VGVTGPMSAPPGVVPGGPWAGPFRIRRTPGPRYTGGPSTCRSGETGRRAGLKIPFPSLGVWVQFPPPAPFDSANPFDTASLMASHIRLGQFLRLGLAHGKPTGTAEANGVPSDRAIGDESRGTSNWIPSNHSARPLRQTVRRIRPEASRRWTASLPANELRLASQRVAAREGCPPLQREQPEPRAALRRWTTPRGLSPIVALLCGEPRLA
jgi:hypothetical protein